MIKKVFPQMNSLPEFYQGAISAVAKSNTQTFPKDTEDVLCLPLWGSKHIKYQSTANEVAALYILNHLLTLNYCILAI